MLHSNITLINDFITETQEKELLTKIISDHSFINTGKGHNQRSGIVRYGKKEHHPDRLVSETIPPYLKNIDIGIPFNSITINKYEAEEWIKWHIDKPKTGEIITVLSLLSSATLNFRHKKDHTQTLSVLLLNKSLVQFKDSLRYEWEHSLKAEELRYSIVFRNIRL